jgi:HEAT repeat protein
MPLAPWLCLALTLTPAAQAAGGKEVQAKGPPPAAAAAAAPAAVETETSADEQLVRSAGLTADGPALLEFFRGRCRREADRTELEALLRQLGDAAAPVRARAAAALVGRGPVAVPALRQAANDLSDPAAAERARQCLKWIEGPEAAELVVAASRLLAERKPAGAAPVLLAYIPLANNADVVEEVARALAAVAYAGGRPDSAVREALDDPLPLRRAVAAEALCRADRPEELAAVRPLLHDRAVGVRLRVALALLRQEDAAAVPVLIDLLPRLSSAQAHQAEEALQDLAGDWAPGLPRAKDDAIARRIRKDTWAVWWKNTEGPALLAEFRRRTPDETQQKKLRALVDKLGADQFTVRERATADLLAFGHLAVPFLREAARGKDPERTQRAEVCLERIAKDDKKALPTAAARLVALRRPPGAVEVLLAYFPWASGDAMAEELQKALVTLAVQDGEPHPALVKALADHEPRRRLAAGEALARRGGRDLWPALQKLLKDPDPAVRVQVGTALIAARDREAVPLLIDALADLPPDQAGQVADVLTELAGDKGPPAAPAGDAAARRKYRDAWTAWWRAHGAQVDLARPGMAGHFLGYTLIVESDGPGRVRELGRDGKDRWKIEGLQFPVDAQVIRGTRVLVTEYNGRRITERDFKGNILWKVENLPSLPVNAQRLPGGNTFIATMAGVMEVDRRGKEVFNHPIPGLIAGCKGRGGEIFCLDQQGQCVVLDARGKQIKTFPSGRLGGWTSGIDAGPAGRVLISQPNQGRVVEFNRDGKMLWQGQAAGVTTATLLPNGHVLTASHNLQTVAELDRSGRVVSQVHCDLHPFRARRR